MSSVKKDDLIFKALADSRRRKMLDLIREKPKTTGQICKHFKSLDRCTVMQHLDVLEKAELVIVKREGRYRWNYINVVPFKEIFDRWIHRYSTHAVDILTRLKHDLEA
jgi:DNA-binding transcriptional ArsR family regulator